MDALMDYHSVDIQWGNHDILWMGAASGSRTLVATVLSNSMRYNNLEVVETGELQTFRIDGEYLSGRAFLDFADTAARRAYYLEPV